MTALDAFTWTAFQADDGPTFDVVDPATGESVITLRDADEAEASAALRRAEGAAAEWAATPVRTRSEVLVRAFTAMSTDPMTALA